MSDTADIIYLDHASATPVDNKVLAAMHPYFSEEFYNPSAIHEGGRRAKKSLEEARGSVARSIGCNPADVTFTAGGTESINLAIHGVMKGHDDSEIIISGIEHEAVRAAASSYNTKVCRVDANGVVDVDHLKQLITDKTKLISIIHASNEIGTVQSIRDIADIVQSVNKRRRLKNSDLLLLHTDASQSPNYLDVHIGRLGVDLMTLNGGKIYGPKQSGILFHKSGITLSPLIGGGGQENGLRSGTENVAFAVGFAKALEMTEKKRKSETKRLQELSHYFVKELESRFDARINGHRKQRLANNVHATFNGCDNERVLFSLDDQGVWAAAGSACHASKDDVPTVLTAIGMSAEEARSSIRFSMGRTTTHETIDRTLEALELALKA